MPDAANAALPGFLKIALQSALPFLRGALTTVAAPLLIEQLAPHVQSWTPAEREALRDVLQGLAAKV